ncbi:GNAT family N-acetyltransferase [Streptomyces sp. NBC_00893]|uniref:GNAT family N-acetyltransferase n=1 Tax=Streptomyces sp. NBC_00893 TaxID=2975862 RepID=UPI002259BC09|nr:GNAT family protein [Streptomyces sp. NBC_00893]MCX4852175.1 GNAT family N-acetyltransferase [Streptomyces sp. NBC_00893]
MNKQIYLRPVMREDLPLLERLNNTGPEIASVYGWFGWSDPTGLTRRWEENGLLTPDSGYLVAAEEETLLGHVSWHRSPQGPLNHSWNIGVGILPEARGRGVGTAAQRMLVQHLFAHTQVNRIDANTDVTNIAEQRALEKAGFTREGILRGAQFRNGHFHDMALYSILRHEVISN